ncbi:MAG: hypothetical protein L0Y38_00850 [Methylococcaceae bacterium]|nr:hypothetical protein [Methylococcaceae bacterium]MCI0667787.1 hypothetical protein [Methylococcaceae bacterium]MCI0732354.1 hypothetical protein [Methylococcaceae bacterium]
MSNIHPVKLMKIPFFFAALMLVSAPAVQAMERDGSVPRGIGQAARQVYDAGQDAGQAAGNASQNASDWFIGQLSVAGESLFGLAEAIGTPIDLFFYDVRQGYETNRSTPDPPAWTGHEPPYSD